MQVVWQNVSNGTVPLTHWAFHLDVAGLGFDAGGDGVRGWTEAHGGVETDRFLGRTAGGVEGMGTAGLSFAGGRGEESTADALTAAVGGDVEAVDDEAAFVERGKQHDLAQDAGVFKGTVANKAPTENLIGFFHAARDIPILRKGIMDQYELTVAKTVYVFDFLITLEVLK